MTARRVYGGIAVGLLVGLAGCGSPAQTDDLATGADASRARPQNLAVAAAPSDFQVVRTFNGGSAALTIAGIPAGWMEVPAQFGVIATQEGTGEQPGTGQPATPPDDVVLAQFMPPLTEPIPNPPPFIIVGSEPTDRVDSSDPSFVRGILATSIPVTINGQPAQMADTTATTGTGGGTLIRQSGDYYVIVIWQGVAIEQVTGVASSSSVNSV
jgi:hypothetical protein